MSVENENNDFIDLMGQAVKKLIKELKVVQGITKELFDLSNQHTSEIIILNDRVTELEKRIFQNIKEKT